MCEVSYGIIFCTGILCVESPYMVRKCIIFLSSHKTTPILVSECHPRSLVIDTARVKRCAIYENTQKYYQYHAIMYFLQIHADKLTFISFWDLF